MKKIISLLLSLTMLLSMVVLPISAAAPTSGLTFTADDGYATTSALSAAPRTIEAWIKVDADASDERLGIIVGNYGSETASSMLDLEVRKNGNPYLYWKNGSASAVTTSFSDVDLRTGEWTHLAVVSTATDAKCYINGTLKQTVEKAFVDIDASSLSPFMIGGDYRTGNTRYLQSSTVGAVALYSDSRTAEQVAADYAAIDYTASTLIGAYDFSVSGMGRLKDYSQKENHLTYTNTADSSKNEQYIQVTDGMMFDNTDGTYYVENALAAAPHTIEAEVYFPATYDTTARGGVIIGNYPGSAKSCINFEVHTSGRLRYYWIDANGDDYAAYFDVNAYCGEWVKLAVTHDYEAGVVKGYVNGELIDTVTDKNVGGGPAIFDGFVLGGDGRSGNAQYFKGNLKSVAMYSDIRTDEEIAKDATAYGTDDLILHYDLSSYKYTDRPATVADACGNNNAVYDVTWLDEEKIETDYAYSFAVVGDTQKLNYYYPEEFHKLYDWIITNKEEKNIQFVFGLGDITEVSNTDEWERAVAGFDALSDAGIPYSVVRGNHDKQTVTVDTKKTFNDALAGSKYDAEIPAEQRFKEGELENTYRTFTVGEEKFVSITLDYGPTDEELAWASEVCEKYSDHKVIVTTHAYMFRDGTTLDAEDVVPPSNSDPANNNGDEVWDEFVKQHENIVLVMSGHDPSAYVVTRKENGVNGNTVTQMLIDAQTEEYNRGAMGMVTMFYFSKDGKTVEVEHYSTVRDQYFLKDNQFTMIWNEVVCDVDLDYKVDITDVMLALRTVLNDQFATRVDTNGDGKATLVDVLRILKKALN